MSQTVQVRHLLAMFQGFQYLGYGGRRVKLTTKNTKDTKKFAAAKIRRRCSIFPGDATTFTMAACRNGGFDWLRANGPAGFRVRSTAPANGRATAERSRDQGRARARSDGQGAA